MKKNKTRLLHNNATLNLLVRQVKTLLFHTKLQLRHLHPMLDQEILSSRTSRWRGFRTKKTSRDTRKKTCVASRVKRKRHGIWGCIKIHHRKGTLREGNLFHLLVKSLTIKWNRFPFLRIIEPRETPSSLSWKMAQNNSTFQSWLGETSDIICTQLRFHPSLQVL